MSLDFQFCPSFLSLLKNILKSFPKSEQDIINSILSLKKNPHGDSYPGFNEYKIIKTRIPLKEYKIGQSKGLRFIYLLLLDKNRIIPLYIYKKGNFKKEHIIKNNIKKNLKLILQELQSGECSENIIT